MKFRLSNLNQANFTPDSEGHFPYEGKWSKPVSKIHIAKSVGTVRSHGLSARWFSNANKYKTGSRISSLTNGEEKYLGVLPIVKFYYDVSFPPMLSLSDTLNGWALKLTGYFRAETTGTYNFYFTGDGEIHQFKIDTISKLTNLIVLSDRLQSGTSFSCTAGVWYALEIIYLSNNVPGTRASLAILWHDGILPEKVLLSAGVTAKDNDIVATGEFPIPYLELPDCNKISLKKNKDSISQLTVTLPLVASDSIYGKGYAYRAYDNSYYNLTDTSIAFKKFNTIRFMDGYVNSGVNELVTQFVGQIRDIKTNLNPKGDSIDVTAMDFSVFPKDQINKDSPTYIDYLIAGHTSNVFGHVNGEKKPQAYDGWEVHKAVENLMINSYIDPFLFTKRKVFTNRSGAAVNGSYLIKGIGLTPLNYLPIPKNYGNSDFINGNQGIADDEYLYKVSVGENYYDTINKFLEPYAMSWGFTSSGYPYVLGYNVPTQIFDDRETSTVTYSAGWSNGTDINCIRATYRYTNTLSASCSANVTGSKFAAICRLTPNAGHPSNPNTKNVKVIIRKNGIIITSSSYNTYYSSTHAYYNGVAQGYNSNLAILEVGNNLTYDTYNISFVDINANYTTLFDAFFAYDEDVSNPYIKLKSGDQSTPASILSMSVGDQSSYLRNESVVIGSRLGTKVAQGDSKIFDTINPNNPVYEHIVSRTLDLNSIYKSTASNFVGRPLTTLVFDPAITDNDQADFIGFGIVDEYRNPHKEISLSIINNPLIDIGDCIAVKDDGKGTVNYEKVWINSIEVERNGSQAIGKIETTPVKPITSWFSKPEPRLSDFGNQPFQNVKIYNGGTITELSQTLSPSETTVMYVSGDLASAPSSGYLQMDGETRYNLAQLQTYIPPSGYAFPMAPQNEIIRYESRSTAGIIPGRLYGLTRGLQYTYIGGTVDENVYWGIGDVVCVGWDPYTQDGFGIAPIIKFDLLCGGDVQCFISVKSSLSNSKSNIKTKVDNLAWNGKDEIDKSSRFFTWGADKTFTYGGMDNYGVWNQASLDPLLKVYKNTFVSEKFKITNRSEDRGFYKEKYIEGYVKLVLKKSDGQKYEYEFGKMILRRGNVGKVNFSIDYSDTYFYGAQNLFSSVGVKTSGTTGPYNKLNPSAVYKPVFFDENSNNFRGMKYRIKEEIPPLKIPSVFRNDSIIDNKYYRYYGGLITANIRTLLTRRTASIENVENGNYISEKIIMEVTEKIDIFEQKEINQLFNENITGIISRYFNPNQQSDLSWIPKEMIIEMQKYFEGNPINSDNDLIIIKFIFFTGNFIDKSGRYAFQWPTIFYNYLTIPGFPGEMQYVSGYPTGQGPLGGYESGESTNGYGSDYHNINISNRGFYNSNTDINGEANLRGNWIGWEDTLGIGNGKICIPIITKAPNAENLIPPIFTTGRFYKREDM